jgi:S-formylglutathione hydrolase FrmB
LAFAVLAAGGLGASDAPAPPVSYRKIRSPSLADPARILVMLPPSYEREPQRRYPVLYFLHDAWSDETALEKYGVARELLRRMSEGSLPEFLIVAPGARGSWFSDSHDGKELWERFLTRDLPAQIESLYRVIPGREARGITGISMGGYGAVKIALRHPDFAAAVSSLSGALIPFGQEDLKRYNFMARWTLRRVFGRSPTDNSLKENDVWQLLWASHFPKPPFSLYLRGGSEDIYGLGRVGAQFAAYSEEHGLQAVAVVEPGGHNWDYWRHAMIPICEWHARRFSYDSRDGAAR